MFNYSFGNLQRLDKQTVSDKTFINKMTIVDSRDWRRYRDV